MKSQNLRSPFVIRTLAVSMLLLVLGITLMSSAAKPQNSLYAMWVHGHSATLEDRRGDSAKLAGNTNTNHAVDLPGHTRFQSHKKGYSSEFYFFDRGRDNKPKNGEVWVHFAIPTPVITNNRRVKAKDVLLLLKGSSERLRIAKIHVWDANKRILARDVNEWGKKSQVRFSIPGTPSVSYGIGVSILIKGERVKASERIEICGVGVDFVL